MGQGQAICCLATPAIEQEPDELQQRSRRDQSKESLLADGANRGVVTVLPENGVKVSAHAAPQPGNAPQDPQVFLGAMAPLVAGPGMEKKVQGAPAPAETPMSEAPPTQTTPIQTPREGADAGTRQSTASGRRSGRASVNDAGRMKDLGAKGKPFPKRPVMNKLSQEFWNKAEELFRKMDPDGSNAVTRDEAMEFFSGAFSNLSTEAMFNEIDQDRSGAITGEEFMAFWAQVKAAGYKEADMIEELDEIIGGGAWVDWKDGRDTTKGTGARFPRRPWLCKLSAKTWDKCRELFEKMDDDNSLVITPEKASRHFKKGFNKISTEAMFNEIDTQRHGRITAEQWMNFWKQVKASGYKNKHIEEELVNLMAGDNWVDWKDGRST